MSPRKISSARHRKASRPAGSPPGPGAPAGQAAAAEGEELALERSVKQRDAEIEALRKQLSEDDLSTPRDRGSALCFATPVGSSI